MVLNEKNLLVKNYKKGKQKGGIQKRITFNVSKKEYQRIQKDSQKAGLSMSRYCKNKVLKEYAVSPTSLPTLSIYEYMGEIREAKVILKQLLDTIYRTGKYYPADLENIQEMVEKITRQQELLHLDFKKYIKEIKKILPH